MIPDCFLDTNVLVYAALARHAAPEKQARAREIIALTHFAVSGQVLQEFFVNVTRKSDRPLPYAVAMQWLHELRDRPCIAVDLDLVVRGAEISARYQTSYWDGAILAAAEAAGAPILYTEDLNHNQIYSKVRVINPFRSPVTPAT
jgi:predicted nucleic acid-binding protein